VQKALRAVLGLILSGSIVGCSTLEPVSRDRKGFFDHLSSLDKPEPRSRGERRGWRTRRQVVSKNDWQWPLENVFITSEFGRRNGRAHEGIDLRARPGTPVFAASHGKVVYSDSRIGGYGNMIVIQHSGDLFTSYAHHQRNLVKVGATVQKGQKIALSGATGRVTGPHLHFEVRQGSKPLNPVEFFQNMGGESERSLALVNSSRQ
jgi:murein DD-endopeptidase MepM/ murein hydrolase activator NlpD